MIVQLYSCYPPNVTANEAARIREQIATEELRLCRERPNGVCTSLISRDLFPTLPWTMNELPGTVWRNVHTFARVIIEGIRENRDGLLGPDPDEWINAMFSIGLWWGERFVIGHWVRVDLLDIAEQMEWYTGEARYCIGRYHEAIQAVKARKRKKRRGSTYGANLRICERKVLWADESKKRAIATAKAFASRNGFAFDLSTINQLTTQVAQIAQLALF